MVDPSRALTISFFYLLTGLLPAQTSQPDKPVKWPKLQTKDESRAKLLIRQLADDDAEVVAGATKGLVELGAGCAPALVRVLEGGDETAQLHACAVLDEILRPEFAPLVVKWLKKDKPPVQRFTTKRLARFRLAELKPVLESQLESDDDLIGFYASLGLAGIGDFSRFDAVFARCQSDWRDVASLVHEVLGPQRSPDRAKRLANDLRSDDEDRVVTALRLMRSLCPESHVSAIMGHLDSSSRRIKVAAINALRVVVDGDEPLENLSAFQAIDHAKRWKERIR